MLTKSEMNFSPEGMNSFFAAVPAMLHDHDDGLVHGHNFVPCTEASSYTIVTKPAARNHVIDHSHDDGLVHGHSWAVSSPER
jgi:hypothetical protein